MDSLDLNDENITYKELIQIKIRFPSTLYFLLEKQPYIYGHDENSYFIHLDVNAFELQCLLEEDQREDFKVSPYVAANVPHDRIISINSIGKEKGITREMKLNQAKKLAPDLKVIEIPLLPSKKKGEKGKPSRVHLEHHKRLLIESIKSNNLFKNLDVEQPSDDEVVIDISQFIAAARNSPQNTKHLVTSIHMNTHIELEEKVENFSKLNPKQDNPLDLKYAGAIATYFMEKILKDTGMEVSIGVSQNKFLAKIACDLHGANSLTIMDLDGYYRLLPDMKISSIPGLKSKKGNKIKDAYQEETISDIVRKGDDIFENFVQIFDGDKEEVEDILERILGFNTEMEQKKPNKPIAFIIESKAGTSANESKAGSSVNESKAGTSANEAKASSSQSKKNDDDVANLYGSFALANWIKCIVYYNEFCRPFTPYKPKRHRP